MDETTNQPIEELVSRFKQKGLSRGRFIAALAGLGASTTAISTILCAAEADAATLPPRRAVTHHTADHHKQLHHAHVTRQGQATAQHPAEVGAASERQTQLLQKIMDDYAGNAVVEDPLFADPIVGKEAIARRKLAEMTAMAGVTIEVAHRFAHHNQVVAEWVMRGTHQGEIFGFPGTGRQIEVRGVTVVTREHGKITRESLHYDVADLYRQLS